MSLGDFVGLTLGMLIGIAFVHFIKRMIDRSDLRSEAEQWMRQDNTKRARILLSLHGHRMDKHTREALTVWLAERGEE